MANRKASAEERRHQRRYVEWNRAVAWVAIFTMAAFGFGFMVGSRWGLHRGLQTQSGPVARAMPPRSDFIPPADEPVTKADEEAVWDYYRSKGPQEPTGAEPTPPASVPKPGVQKKTPRVPEEKSTSPGRFCVQVSSFRDRQRAQRLAVRLISKGYPSVRVASADVPGRGRWYRVRVGNFDARDKAERMAATIRSREGLSPKVILEGEGAQ
jgi:cell division protein FtsN